MDALAGNITQRGVDQALALEPGDTGKGGAFDLHGEVRFAAAVIAGMAVVARGIVDHREVGGGEGCLQQLFDFVGDFGGEGSGHVFPSSRLDGMGKGMQHDRFHGRIAGQPRHCQAPGCPEPGEFRAPGEQRPGFDGPGDYRWFCLDHVRAFNAGYDYFSGMSQDEIVAAQNPVHGWERETRAFSPTAGIDGAPRWRDFADPLDAINQRYRARHPAQRSDGRAVTPEERRALEVLGLPLDANRTDLRSRYSQMVRKYHPDRNGGDRSYEQRLQEVVEAYQLLRKAAAFS